MTTDWTRDTLAPLGACEDAVTWCRTQPDLAAAWLSCERGEWMLWYAMRLCKGLAPETSAWHGRRVIRP